MWRDKTKVKSLNITNYEVPCGYGGTKGKLKIYCGGNSRTIYSY